MDIDARRLRAFHPDRESAEAAATTLGSSATVYLAYDAKGQPLRWQLVSPGHDCWSRQAAWITAPPAIPNASVRRFLLRDIVDDSGEQQCFTSVLQLDVSGDALTIRPIATSRFTLNGTGIWQRLVPGLLECPAGYVLYGAQSPMRDGAGGEFACVAVRLDDGRCWSRSLRAVQPRFGEYHYGQRIHLAQLPDHWLLLDLDGDGFGLQDTAWLWNTVTDEQYAIPLAAVSEDRENAALHYQPETGCLFAHGTPMDRDGWLEMLQPLPNVIAAVTRVASWQRHPAPWIAEESALGDGAHSHER